MVLVRVNIFVLHQSGNAVGELDFAAGTLGLVADLLKNARCQDVPAGHGHA